MQDGTNATAQKRKIELRYGVALIESRKVREMSVLQVELELEGGWGKKRCCHVSVVMTTLARGQLCLGVHLCSLTAV